MSGKPLSRIRPSDPQWPSETEWNQLRDEVEGRLVPVEAPLAELAAGKYPADAKDFFARLSNPYFIGDRAGLTQTLAWVGAWTSQASVYAVAAEGTQDIVAAVNFARKHNLRIVIRGGGHSYKGTSNARDSLMIWTRRMRKITVHDAFVAAGCEGEQAPVPAVTVEAGTLWGEAYDAVATKGGRYMQGGGCLSVGVAGLVQAGGFGSLSKAFGLAAASLLEAEIVTADGVVRTANAVRDPDLFWALKGGGGGTFGVVTRLTLATHEAPMQVGRALVTIEASSDVAFRRLVARTIGFYREALFNPNWGEQIEFLPGNRIFVHMVFQGFGAAEARAVWQPFLDWVASEPQHFTVTSPAEFKAVAGRDFWNPKVHPESFFRDDQTDAPETSVFWIGNKAEAGVVLHGYRSAWLPASLLEPHRQDLLVDALCAAAANWGLSLHMNKGLAGGSDAARQSALGTVMNPAVVDAFALLICAAGEPSAYPGIAGHEPNAGKAAEHVAATGRVMAEIDRVAPGAGCYGAESDFHHPDWQSAFWGANYARLAAVKKTYDPDGLFFVHQGAGSEQWSADGFERSPASA